MTNPLTIVFSIICFVLNFKRWFQIGEEFFPYENSVGVYSTEGTFSDTRKPGGRVDHGMTIIGTSIFVYGGYGYSTHVSDKGHLNDLWEFNFAQGTNGQWKYISGGDIRGLSATTGSLDVFDASNTPGGLSGHHIFAAGNSIFLTMGVDSTWTFHNRIWEFDLSEYEWRVRRESGMELYCDTEGSFSSSVYPSQLYLPMLSMKSSTLAVIFGGDAWFEGRNDIFEYDVEQNLYRCVKGSYTDSHTGSYSAKGVFSSSNLPQSRVEASNWFVNNSFFVYGGATSTFDIPEQLSDLCEFDYSIGGGQWAWIGGKLTRDDTEVINEKFVYDSLNYPQSMLTGIAWADTEGEHLYLSHGGTDYFGEDARHDLWSIGLNNGYQFRFVNGSGLGGQESNTYQMGGRVSLASVVFNDESGLHVFAFGGIMWHNSTVTLYNDIWVFTTECGGVLGYNPTVCGGYKCEESEDNVTDSCICPGGGYYCDNQTICPAETYYKCSWISKRPTFLSLFIEFCSGYIWIVVGCVVMILIVWCSVCFFLILLRRFTKRTKNFTTPIMKF